MNPYELLIPQLLAGAAIVFFAIRAVRQSRRATAEHEQRIAARLTEHNRYLAELKATTASVDHPSVLNVTLDLGESQAVADVGRVARDAERLIASLSGYEEAMGGRGLILTGASANPGKVILTLTPKYANGATDRVLRVADAVNAAFDTMEATVGTPAANFGSLPAEFSKAHALVI